MPLPHWRSLRLRLIRCSVFPSLRSLWYLFKFENEHRKTLSSIHSTAGVCRGTCTPSLGAIWLRQIDSVTPILIYLLHTRVAQCTNTMAKRMVKLEFLAPGPNQRHHQFWMHHQSKAKPKSIWRISKHMGLSRKVIIHTEMKTKTHSFRNAIRKSHIFIRKTQIHQFVMLAKCGFPCAFDTLQQAAAAFGPRLVQ